MKAPAIAVLMASQAAARYYTSPLIAAGPYGSDPNFGDNRSDEVYRKAIQEPRATRSIKFFPFPYFLDRLPDGSPREWTWRINVTEFAFPSDIEPVDPEGNLAAVSDPHHISTTYDFEWPGGENLSEALQGSTRPFCISSPDVVFPENVTDLYTEDNANSTDCTPVLGDDCVQAILRIGNNISFREKCTPPSTIWSQIPECNATLGYAARARLNQETFASFGIFTANLSPDPTNSGLNSTNTRNKTAGISSGEGFVGLHSGVIEGSNATEKYLAAASRLHILMISHTFENGGNAELLCMRVNTTGSSDQGSPAAPAHNPVTWTLAMAIVTAFAVII